MKLSHPSKLLALAVVIICSLLAAAYAAPLQTIFVQHQVDDVWTAEPMHIREFAEPFAVSGYTPQQIKTAYNLPASGGAGATIAIIIAYDTPNIRSYLEVFSAAFDLPLPTDSNFEVHKMSSSIAFNSSWSLEACLDVQWAHAIAPEAKILLVEAENPSSTALLSAIEYATSRPDVTAVSMSWGGREQPTSWLWNTYFDKPGIAFFASSGDEGAEVNWPAVSPYVVAVGGTTLNLYDNGTVISETGWSGSGGGISAYQEIPPYQTSYGLTTSKRSVPDVSYNADLATGVPVYDGSWHKVGGTSAGAPQWAAIHALGLSATNTNLYHKAKAAYSIYFRDIISGSNGYSANTGYDYVTGLGSPLTTNFRTEVTVSPALGPAGAPITLDGVGFTAGSSIDISCLNPISSTWTTVVDDWATASESFSYQTTVPDLMQNNPAGDSSPLSDSIIFRVTDNGSGNVYNATFTEYRRGLTQAGFSGAQGVFGNNTDLSGSVFVQSGGSLPVEGRWFSPGTATLFWDDINIGSVVVGENGQFSASVTVPASSVGQHTLMIRDASASFCVNLTKEPTVAVDYADVWHTSDFTVNLTPDYDVSDVYYRINNGGVYAVSVNGQPAMTSEGSGNTLEYWSIWNPFGTETQTAHQTVTGIKLDKTAPAGTITANPTAVAPAITLSLSAADDVSGVAKMRFSNDGVSWSSWEPYATAKTWTLQGENGAKNVYVQYIDNAGLTSTYSCAVTLDVPESTPTPSASVLIQSPSSTPDTEEKAGFWVTPETAGLIIGLVIAGTVILALLHKKNKSK